MKDVVQISIYTFLKLVLERIKRKFSVSKNKLDIRELCNLVEF